MSARPATVKWTPWVWVGAAIYSALILGVGVWASVATGQWFALVLSLGLVAPIDVLLIRRYRRRATR
ncbi:hypothetical protein [Salinibacterium sp. ZJ450]|uniref:hypothetical protein n=1 Tax=Salinibacterium sp. ZJ450 TaxID=2708338 RepID=UPI00141FEFA4|nr:hypothetical protein [Salinibacterium sp. ZJ450]